MVVEKRKGDESALVPASKRNKNEVAVSNKNKSVLQAVSFITYKNFLFRYLSNLINCTGAGKNIKFVRTHNAVGGARRGTFYC